MRVNIYAEEMTDRVEVIEKEIDGTKFTALRFYLELPATVGGHQYQGPFIHKPGDDDSSGVTFWGKQDLRVMLRKALHLLDKHYDGEDQPGNTPVHLDRSDAKLARFSFTMDNSLRATSVEVENGYFCKYHEAVAVINHWYSMAKQLQHTNRMLKAQLILANKGTVLKAKKPRSAKKIIKQTEALALRFANSAGFEFVGTQMRDHQDPRVRGWFDLASMAQEELRKTDVENAIAELEQDAPADE